MIITIICYLALPVNDPEQLLDRIHFNLQESTQFFNSYANSQLITSPELVSLRNQLDTLTLNFEHLLKPTLTPILNELQYS